MWIRESKIKRKEKRYYKIVIKKRKVIKENIINKIKIFKKK